MNNIDKIFKAALQTHREAPSTHVWTKLDKKLDADQLRKYKRRLYWVSLSSLIILLLFVGYVTYDVMTRHKTAALTQTIVAKQHSFVMENKSPSTNRHKYEHTETVINRSPYLELERLSVSRKRFPDPQPAFYSSEIALHEHVSGISVASFPGQEREHLLIPAENIQPTQNTAMQTSSTSPTVARKRKPLFLGLSFSPLLPGNRMVEMYDFDDHSLNDYKDQERPDMSWSAAVTAEIPVRRNISVLTGIGIAELFTSIKPLTAKAVKADDNGNYSLAFASSLGIVNVKDASNPAPRQNDTFKLHKESSQHLRYFTIPVALKWSYSSSKKIRWSVMGGISSNFITKGQVEVVANDGTSMEKSTRYNINGVRKHFLAGMAAVGIDYQIGHHLLINVTPQYNFGLTPINRSTPVKSYTTSLQLNTGIAFRF